MSVICNRCKISMNKVISCDKGRLYQYMKCPVCCKETKRIPYFFKKTSKAGKY